MGLQNSAFIYISLYMCIYFFFLLRLMKNSLYWWALCCQLKINSFFLTIFYFNFFNWLKAANKDLHYFTLLQATDWCKGFFLHMCVYLYIHTFICKLFSQLFSKFLIWHFKRTKLIFCETVPSLHAQTNWNICLHVVIQVRVGFFCSHWQLFLRPELPHL